MGISGQPFRRAQVQTMIKGTFDEDIGWMVDAYAEYVYRLAYEFTCDPVDAEDVTCATFLSARALFGHVSECDYVAAILYGITSSIAQDKLESNLNADEPDVDAYQTHTTLTSCLALSEAELAAVGIRLARDGDAGPTEYLDVSLDRFRPALEKARALIDMAIWKGNPGG